MDKYRELLTIGDKGQLVLEVKIKGVLIQALINSRVISNFILLQVIIEYRQYTIIIKELYILKVVDRALVLSRLVEAEIVLLDIVINKNYYKFVIFNITNTRRY